MVKEFDSLSDQEKKQYNETPSKLEEGFDYKDEEQEYRGKTFRLAGFWIRFYAYLIDLIIIGSITFLFFRPILNLVGLSTDLPLISISLSSLGVIAAFYFVFMTKLWSQTMGKMIFGLKVIKHNGKSLDWLTVIFREIVGRTISQLIGLHIGYIWAAFHPKKQTWHDQLMDTYVVFDEEVVVKQTIEV
jgi:uncharacterized RDD family membrane protein YckC